MKKIGKRIGLCALAAAVVWTIGLVRDKQILGEKVLRLHVVGASNSQEDQNVKLQVRDAVLGSLEEGLEGLTDPEQARDYVRSQLPKLEQAANRVLEEMGFDQRAEVRLGREEFPTREYDTFTLPAGVYHALRVVIGEGEGKNWWCVVFPKLCTGAAGEPLEEVGAFPDTLNGSIQGEYEIRFWILDQWGRIENFLRRSSPGA